MFLDYLALGVLIFVGLTLFYGIIAIHDIPYDIAKHRNHPHQDAIHVAGWVSLFTLHVLWPFLWIWAMLYRPDRGWGMAVDDGSGKSTPAVALIEERIARLEQLEQRMTNLEQRVAGQKFEQRVGKKLEQLAAVENS